MTIDEAISLLRIERECILRADMCNRKCEKCDLLQDSTDLEDMYEQVVEWLEELKAYRASVFSGDMTQSMLKEERNKAIDDFSSKLIMHFADWELSQAPCNDDETDRTREIICETIENAIGGVEEIAEQLKAGVDNE